MLLSLPRNQLRNWVRFLSNFYFTQSLPVAFFTSSGKCERFIFFPWGLTTKYSANSLTVRIFLSWFGFLHYFLKSCFCCYPEEYTISNVNLQWDLESPHYFQKELFLDRNYHNVVHLVEDNKTYQWMEKWMRSFLVNKNLSLYFWLRGRIGKERAFRVANTVEKMILIFGRERA